MSEKSSSSEETTESGQPNAPQTIDVAKYFLSVIDGGKPYSICLIKDCCRRFEGNNVDELKTHLNVTHYMNLHSTSTTCPDLESADSHQLSISGKEQDLSESPETIACTEEKPTIIATESNAIQLQDVDFPEVFSACSDAISEPKCVQDYFQVFVEDEKIYSKCLVGKCRLTMSGKHSGNMYKHLKRVHKMENIPRKCGRSAARKARNYFRLISDNGRTYSKCLIKGCSYRIESALLKDLTSHLGTAHKMTLYSMSKEQSPTAVNNLAEKATSSSRSESNAAPTSTMSVENPFAEDVASKKKVREFFRIYSENDKIYSKCLVDDCSMRLSGKHSHSMLKHLHRRHGMTNIQPINNRRVSIRFPVQTNESETTDVRDWFNVTTKNGVVHAKCLVKDCEIRLSGNHRGNLVKHLKNVHHMCVLPRRTDRGKTQEADLITLENITLPPLNAAAAEEDTLCDDKDEVYAELFAPDVPNRFCSAKPVYARKYFQTWTKHGKTYSECLVKDCNIRLPGNHSMNMMSHMQTAHNNSFLELKQVPQKVRGKTRRHFRTIFEGTKTYSECLICHRRLSGSILGNLTNHLRRIHNIHGEIVNRCAKKKENSREVDIFRKETAKHFRVFTKNGRVFTKCVIPNCDERMRGRNTAGMVHHLKTMHKHLITASDRDAPAADESDSDDENSTESTAGHDAKENILTTPLTVNTTTSTPMIAGITQSIDHTIRIESKLLPGQIAIKNPNHMGRQAARKYFRAITVNGQKFGDCLVKNCHKRLRGQHLGNWAKHLIRCHNITDLYSENSSVDNAFDVNIVQFGGRATTKSRLDETDSLHTSEEEMHNEPFEVLENTRETHNHPRNLSGQSIRPRETSTRHSKSADSLLRNRKGVRNYFRVSIDDGYVQSKCLVKDCESRLSGDHSYAMFKHLQNKHKIFAFSTWPKIQTADKTLTKKGPKSRCIAKEYFHIFSEDGTVYADCRVENCNKRLKGDHQGNLSKHLRRSHNIHNLHVDSTSVSADGENSADIISKSLNENSNENDELQDEECSQGHADDHEWTTADVHKADHASHTIKTRTSSLSMSEDTSQHSHENTEKVGARKYYKPVEIDGVKYSRCLVCNRLMKGTHLSNLKKHLARTHRIVFEPRKSKPDLDSVDKVCRLCFQNGSKLFNIFQTRLNVAGLIRIHFPSLEVNCFIRNKY